MTSSVIKASPLSAATRAIVGHQRPGMPLRGQLDIALRLAPIRFDSSVAPPIARMISDAVMPDSLPNFLAKRKRQSSGRVAKDSGEINANEDGNLPPVARQKATMEAAPTRQRPKKPLTRFQRELMARLAALQAEMGLNHEQIAAYLGVGRTTWTNWTNGEVKPAEEAMIRLCHIGRVDMDWLYRGNIDRLPIGHAIRLTARLKGIDPDEAGVDVLFNAEEPSAVDSGGS